MRVEEGEGGGAHAPDGVGGARGAGEVPRCGGGGRRRWEVEGL